jgi:cell division protein FtsZ
MGFEPELINPPGAKIKVIGVGGGGGNAVNTMIRAGLDCVEFISANTDVQALRFSMAPTHIQIGKELTKGLGAGADPDVGRESAIEDRKDIENALKGADMVFITAGMGGGTGTGGAAVIAQIARELGALTVAVVTKPFNFEGKRRRKYAEAGIARLREAVDTLITIPNQRLLQIATPDLSMIDAFKMADNVVVNAVRGISDIINVPGLINADFADVKTVMSNMGHSLMGIGHATGPKRAAEAARMAISSPLLDDLDIQGATGVLISITAGSSLGLMEVDEICTIVQESAHEDATSIWGAVIDESLGDAIRVTVIATGFPVESGATSTAHEIIRPSTTSIYSPNYATGADIIGRVKTSPIFSTPDLAASAALTTTESSKVQSPQSKESSAVVLDDVLDQVSTESNACAPDVLAGQSGTTSVAEQKIEALAEAQELARWTIDQTADSSSDEESFVSVEANFAAGPITETSVDTAGSIFNDDFGEESISVQSAGDEAPIESFFENSPVVTREVEGVKQAGLPDMDLTSDIDRKIDEALALAQKLRTMGATAKPSQPASASVQGARSLLQNNVKAPSEMVSEEDLDIPAFLRNANQDISLD